MSGLDNTSLTVRHLVQAAQQQTVQPTDSIIIWTSNGFAVYTLPLAAAAPGRMVTFVKDPAGSGSIQVFPASGDTADGTTQSWDSLGQLTVVSDGVNGWWSTYSNNTTRV